MRPENSETSGGTISWSGLMVRGNSMSCSKRRKVKDSTIEKYYAPFGKWRGLFLWMDVTKIGHQESFHSKISRQDKIVRTSTLSTISEIEVIIDSGGTSERAENRCKYTRCGSCRYDRTEGTGLTSLTSSLRKTPTP